MSWYAMPVVSNSGWKRLAPVVPAMRRLAACPFSVVARKW
jgi:hypothetical protein